MLPRPSRAANAAPALGWRERVALALFAGALGSASLAAAEEPVPGEAAQPVPVPEAAPAETDPRSALARDRAEAIEMIRRDPEKEPVPLAEDPELAALAARTIAHQEALAREDDARDAPDGEPVPNDEGAE